MDNNASIKIIIVTALICLLTSLPLGILIGKYVLSDDKNESVNETTKVQENESDDQKEESVSSSLNAEKKKICSSLMNAKYYGEYVNEARKIHQINTVTFKDDGTFENFVEDAETIKGEYTIKGNTLTTYTCPALGPCEQKTEINHIIADDCSYIEWDAARSYNIYLQ